MTGVTGVTAGEAVDAANAIFGRQHGNRALHAKGLLLKGTFTGAAPARGLTSAAHFTGEEVPVTARFSNGSGSPSAPDYLPEVRGLAVKFYLPDGSRTDIVAQTARYFPVATPEEFVALLRAASPRWRAPLGLAAFFATHPRAALRLARNQRLLAPPLTFASVAYYAVHAYRWVNADGGISHVRYAWRPAGPERRISPIRAARGGRDYLHEGMRRQITQAPVRFRLEVQVAGPRDELDDPSADWPAQRRRFHAGTLTLNALEEGRERDGDVLVFDPTRVCEGIELTDDPVLRFRSPAYRESVARRSSG